MIPVCGKTFCVRVAHHGFKLHEATHSGQTTREVSNIAYFVSRGERIEAVCGVCHYNIIISALTIRDTWKMRLTCLYLAIMWMLFDAFCIGIFIGIAPLTEISAIFGIGYFFAICGVAFCTLSMLGNLVNAFFSQGVIVAQDVGHHSLSVRFVRKR